MNKSLAFLIPASFVLSSVLCSFFAFPASHKNRGLRQMLVDSCIIESGRFKIDSVDRFHNSFSKPVIEGLTSKIKTCYPKYPYPDSYVDHSMKIIFPAYLKKLNYEFSDNQFTIRFDDEKGERTICINYDFENTMRATLLDYSKRDGQKVVFEKIDNKELIFSKNWQGEYTASIFLNSISVAYYTKNRKYVNELKEAILSFSMD